MAVTPAQAMEQALHRRVSLLLKDGRRLAGQLERFDDHMNMVLTQVEEEGVTGKRTLGQLLLRGSNVVSISME